jgi:hypothetical protein
MSSKQEILESLAGWMDKHDNDQEFDIVEQTLYGFLIFTKRRKPAEG